MKKRLLGGGMVFSVVLTMLFSSCVREDYNLNRPLDLTMQVGGDSLSLPLGFTERLTMDSLLGEESLSDILMVNEAGEYVLSLDTLSISEEIDEVPVRAFLLDSIGTLQKFDVQMSVPVESASVSPRTVAEATGMAGDVYQEIQLDFEFNGISKEVHELHYMYFVEKTRVRVLFDLTGVPDQIDLSRVRPELILQLPEEFYINDPLVDENNRIQVQSFNAGAGRFQFDFSLDGLDLSKTDLKDGKLHYTSVLTLSGKLVLTEDPVSSTLPDRKSGTEFTLKSQLRYSVVNLAPSRVKGVFSLSIPAQRLSVELGQMPDMFTAPDAVLDFARPRILIDLSTNTGVVIDARLRIVPVYGASPDVSMMQQALLHIPAGEVDRMHAYRFWLAKDREDMPEDCLFAEMDVSAFLKHMPDSLQVWVDVSTDTDQIHEYVFGQPSVLRARIRPEVPLVFGPELNIPYDDTISGLGDKIASLLDGNQMEVIAEVTNSLPLAIRIGLELLDSDGAVIPAATTGEQVIRACDDRQQAQLSVVSFGFSGRDDVLQGKDVASLRLVCSLRSDEKSAGLPVLQTSYFQAKLKAKFEGGIFIDANKKN